MPKIDINQVTVSHGSGYPAPFAAPCRERHTARLALAAGLTQFGANLVTLKPGAWSSQRHWHAHEDEFVFVVSGELVLVEDEGEVVLRQGDSAAWRAGVRNGHHLQNRSNQDAVFLAVGSRSDADWGEYPDIDLRFEPGRYSGGGGYRHKDGTPY